LMEHYPDVQHVFLAGPHRRHRRCHLLPVLPGTAPRSVGYVRQVRGFEQALYVSLQAAALRDLPLIGPGY
jgi:hypothetical protein